MNRLRALGFTFALLFAFTATADQAFPPCMANGKKLGITNAQVKQWKETTQNQFLGRARVRGVLSKMYEERKTHAHFQIEFDGGVEDTLEVVYNFGFGKLPKLAVGMEIEACGDYITSNRPTAKYPVPSPDGGIIHWVHRTTGRHEAGYLAIDGQLYGQGSGWSVFDLIPAEAF